MVDDGSTDNTSEIATSLGVHYVRLPFALGPAGARNRGVQETAGEILVFVDSDVVVRSDALRLIAEDFANDPDLAAVFGSYDDQPAEQTFLSQYKNLMHHYVHQASGEAALSFWAGCGAMRRRVFEEFGGFDAEKYPEPSIEDIALGHRLYLAGRKIRLDKRLQAKHLKRWTVRSLLRADILCRAVPWTHLILEARQIPRDLNLTYGSRLSALLVGALALGLVLAGFSVAGLRVIPIRMLLVLLIPMLAALAALNWGVYQFFYRKRGWWFAMRVVPLHWLYYFYSSATFAVCAAMHFAKPPTPAARPNSQGKQGSGGLLS